jgi:hypothetical protein
MKQDRSPIDATPSKRLYLSIIADYNTNLAISELVDNALDLWTLGGRINRLNIDILLDNVQQRILVKDNAGGISESDLTFIVAPGLSKSTDLEDIIGVFGVGSKRAVIALAQDITIRTRKDNDTFQIEIDDDWIEKNPDWNLPVYSVPLIDKGSTEIELMKLRKPIDENVEKHLYEHLCETYAIFLKNQKLTITLNEKSVVPKTFEKWAFPPKYEPHNYMGELEISSGRKVGVFVTAGLSLESNQTSGDYGVYFYCNDRLIIQGLKTYEVGFSKGIAGRPHADISLARIIISLHGSPRLMPWNSSKSGLNTSHEVFQALQTWIMTVVKDNTSLSRRLSKIEGGWPENVFKYTQGEISDLEIPNLSKAIVSYLPKLPEA